MADWNWELIVGLTALALTGLVAYLQIRQQRSESKRAEKWRKEDLERQQQAEVDRLPKFEFGFFVDGQITKAIKVNGRDLNDWLSDEQIEAEVSAITEQLLKDAEKLDRPYSRVLKKYRGEVTEYKKDLRAWYQSQRVLQSSYHLEFQVAAKNTGKIDIGSLVIAIDLPEYQLEYIGREDWRSIWVMDEPEEPELPHVASDMIDLIDSLAITSLTGPMSPHALAGLWNAPPIDTINSAEYEWMEEGKLVVNLEDLYVGRPRSSSFIALIVAPPQFEELEMHYTIHGTALEMTVEGNLRVMIERGDRLPETTG